MHIYAVCMHIYRLWWYECTNGNFIKWIFSTLSFLTISIWAECFEKNLRPLSNNFCNSSSLSIAQTLHLSNLITVLVRFPWTESLTFFSVVMLVCTMLNKNLNIWIKMLSVVRSVRWSSQFLRSFNLFLNNFIHELCVWVERCCF